MLIPRFIGGAKCDIHRISEIKRGLLCADSPKGLLSADSPIKWWCSVRDPPITVNIPSAQRKSVEGEYCHMVENFMG